MVSKEVILEALEEYNRFREPEVKASLISFKDNIFVVKFEGTFCLTCGFYDYFEDLIYILEEKGVKVEIKNIEEIENGAVVSYEIGYKGKFKPRLTVFLLDVD